MLLAATARKWNHAGRGVLEVEAPQSNEGYLSYLVDYCAVIIFPHRGFTAGATAERSLISNIDFSPTDWEMLVRIGPASVTPNWSARSLLHINGIPVLSVSRTRSFSGRVALCSQYPSKASWKHMIALRYIENRWIVRACGVVLTHGVLYLTNHGSYANIA